MKSIHSKYELTYFAFLSGESILTNASKFALLQVFAVAFIQTRIFFARIQIFIAQEAAPILLANAFPRRSVARAVLASGVWDALVAQVALPTERASGERGWGGRQRKDRTKKTKNI